jgi:hydroxymethylbilane synthase
MTLRLGTRGSELALWQARHVARLLPEPCEVVVVPTEGDQNLQDPLHRMGGVGVFTRALERALLAGDIDLAVHSYKDLPTQLPPGLIVAAVPPRGPTRDVLVGKLFPGARVGTSSLRRRAHLAAWVAGLEFVDLRGNVPRRLAAVSEGNVDATVLAEAGLVRLGRMQGEPIPEDQVCPAPAQGALAVQCRDRDVPAALAVLEDAPTRVAVDAEREILRRFDGGCHLPLGVLAQGDAARIRLRALVAAAQRRLYVVHEGAPAAVVDQVYRDLVAQGAEALLSG